MLIRCAVCGRENDPSSKFCIDCGKSIAPSGAVNAALDATITGRSHAASGGRFGVPSTRVSAKADETGARALSPVRPQEAVRGPDGTKSPCPHCLITIDLSLPFCPKCGGRITATPPAAASRAVCASCGNIVESGVDVFCALCGTRVASTAAAPTPAVGTAVFSPSGSAVGPKLAVLDGNGDVKRIETLPGPEATIGRADGDVRFPDDAYMSPVHAQFSIRDGQLFVRDLGSRNGTWVFTDEPYKLQDGDTVLVGSQILRFRRLGYPGPHPPEADATRRLGSSTPSADIAVMQQLRADSSARDNCHLSPSRNVVIGRSEGDWLFAYDKTMSGRHAEIRSEDLEFIVIDLGSRNGIAIAVRGERRLKPGQRILIGDQTLRVESL